MRLSLQDLEPAPQAPSTASMFDDLLPKASLRVSSELEVRMSNGPQS